MDMIPTEEFCMILSVLIRWSTVQTGRHKSMHRHV